MTGGPHESTRELLAHALGAAGVAVLLAAGIVLGATPLLLGLLLSELVPGLGALTIDSLRSLIGRLTGTLCGTVVAELFGRRVAYRLLLIHTTLKRGSARIAATVVSAVVGFVAGVLLLAPIMEDAWRAVVTMAIAEALSIPFARLLSSGSDEGPGDAAPSQRT